MKGLEKTPSPNDLMKAYDQLQAGPLSLSLLMETFEWVRFDPRLGEILASSIEKNWRHLNPFEIFNGLLLSTWPAVMGVLLDMAQLQIVPGEIKQYRIWKKCATANLKNAQNEQFFIGLYSLAGSQMLRQVERSNKIYRRWGYFGEDLFFNKANNQKVRGTLVKKELRLRVLNQLLAQKRSISVNDYIEALPAPVSRRIAELDLHHFKGLKRQGQTKGRVYRKIG